jgi:hypothetical protein
MPDWDKILAQVAVVTSAPVPFLLAVLIMAGLIWLAMDWRYGSVITGRDGIIANKDSEITLLKGQRDEQRQIKRKLVLTLLKRGLHPSNPGG